MQPKRKRWWRSNAFLQSILYFALLAMTAGGVVAYLAWNMQVTLHDEITQTVDAEVRGLAEQYEAGGIRNLVNTVDRRSRNPDNSVYLITDFRGVALAGNIAALPNGILNQPGRHDITYQRLGGAESQQQSHAITQVFVLSGGFRLVVGRDTSERERFIALITRAAWWGGAWVLLLGIGGGYLIARRTLRRIDTVGATAQRIMDGDMSERVPVTGANDEFDRLAGQLNSMLDRIGKLMAGMREVSDNVAHDLRTPLTRMRGRIEAALRDQDPGRMGETLEETLSDTDQLIATFNALLTIARAEFGSADQLSDLVDMHELANEIAELYEPSAAEHGLELAASGTACLVKGNRDLLAQAVSNLVENAIGHGRSKDKTQGVIHLAASPEGPLCRISVTDQGPGIAPEDRERVLERFVRLEQSRSEAGSGLGLSLVAAIASMHGGTVRLEDNDPGLRAILELPLETHEPHERQLPAH